MESLAQVKIQNNLHSGRFDFLPCKKSVLEESAIPKDTKISASLAIECYRNLQNILKDHKTGFLSRKILGKKTIYDQLNKYVRKLSNNFKSATSNPIEAAEFIKSAIYDIDMCTKSPLFYYALLDHMKILSAKLQDGGYYPEDLENIVKEYIKEISEEASLYDKTKEKIKKGINKVYKIFKPSEKISIYSGIKEYFKNLSKMFESVEYYPKQVKKITEEQNDFLRCMCKNSEKFSEGVDMEIMTIIKTQFTILGNAIVGEKIMKSDKLLLRKTNMCDITGTQVFSMVVPSISNSVILITIESHGLMPLILKLSGFNRSIKPTSDDLGILLADFSFNIKEKTSLWFLKFLADSISGAKEEDLKDIIRLRVYLLTSNSILKKGKKALDISSKSKREINLI